MKTSTETLDVTVVVVSDYESGEVKTWADEIAMLERLSEQDIQTPFQVIIAEDEKIADLDPPASLTDAFPGAKIVYYASEASAALKDFAVTTVTTPWVIVVEADALPEKDWLRLLVAAATEHPEFDIFSGRTWYGGETSWQRCLNLIGRSVDDRGVSGPSEHVSNNGALYRTQTLLKFPYPDAPSPFLSARQRLAEMKQAGLKFYSCREARMRHAIGGFDFVLDVHRNAGYGDMMMALEQQAKHMPAISFQRMKSEFGAALRVGGDYLKIWDWPLWAFMYCFVRIPEWRGMAEALRAPTRLEGSAYR